MLKLMGRVTPIVFASTMASLLSGCGGEDHKPALEAVAFILFGQDNNAVEKQRFVMVTDGNVATLEGQENWSVGRERIQITQKSPCEYSISGKNFFSDKLYPLELTADFSGIRAENSDVSSNRSGVRVLQVPGIKACSATVGPRTEGFPDRGCQDFVLRSIYTKDDKERVVSAGKQLATFCKPRAF